MKDIKKEIMVELAAVFISLVLIILVYILPVYFKTSSLDSNYLSKQITSNIFLARKNFESIFVGVLSSLIVALLLTVNHFLERKKILLNSIINCTKKLIYIYHYIPINNTLLLSNDLKIEYYLRYKNHFGIKKSKQKLLKLLNDNKMLASKGGYNEDSNKKTFFLNIIIEYDFYCRKIKEFISKNIKEIENITAELENCAISISNIFCYNHNKKSDIIYELTNNVPANSLFDEIIHVNNYKDVVNRILVLNDRMITKLKKLVDDLDLENFLQYYVSVGADILGKYHRNTNTKYPIFDKSNDCTYYNKFCWILGNLVNVLLFEITNEIQYDSHHGYQKQFYYIKNSKVYINMFKEYINGNLNSIYDFKKDWFTCPDYVFVPKEIND